MDLNSSNQLSIDCHMSEPDFLDNTVSIAASLEYLNRSVVDIDTSIAKCRNKQEDRNIQQQNYLKKSEEIDLLHLFPKSDQRDQQIQQLTREKQFFEQTVSVKGKHLLEWIMVVMNRLSNIPQIISIINTRIKEKLTMWIASNQKQLRRAPEQEQLDQFQSWFESLTEILLHLNRMTSQYKLLLGNLPHSNNIEKIDKLKQDLTTYLKQHIRISFIVDEQPRQVIKTQIKFQASVRLLVGSKFDFQMNCPEVTVSLLSENQCKELGKGKSLAEIGTCGQILNNKCIMDHCKCSNESPILKAYFKNLQLKNIQREDKKGYESVLEAKYALVFSTELNISGDLLSVIAISVPVVIVVHSNQIPNSEATIVWDSMFSNPEREPFVTPDSVTWEELSNALNARWTPSNETELHADHLKFLQDKIFSTLDLKSDSSLDTKISWSSFNKVAVVWGKNFTFWEWFYGAIEVVKKSLKDYWKNGVLEFCTKEMCKIKLLEKQSGTFMIRFSEGEIGAVSIAWCKEINGLKEVMNLQPWKSDDFSVRNLADRIYDLLELTHLYPDTKKELAFEPFKTIQAANTENRGYVDTGIFTRILPDPLSDQMDDDDDNTDLATLGTNLQIDSFQALFDSFPGEFDL